MALAKWLEQQPCVESVIYPGLEHHPDHALAEKQFGGRGFGGMVISYIYGLGGRDVSVDSIGKVYADLEEMAAAGKPGSTYRFLEVRE